LSKRARIGFVFFALLFSAVAVPHFSDAQTARQQGGRIVVDGFATEYHEMEALFGKHPETGGPEEPTFDSKWGPDNDFNQIKITWDKDTLYVAAEGVIWNNNMIVLFDVIPDRGMENMQSLDSWRRNFVFSDDFRPDIFMATWDGNGSPRLLIHQGDNAVLDNQVGELFRAAATFSTNLRGRAMEFAIPWDVFYLGPDGLGTVPRFAPALRETLQTIPAEWTKIKIAGVLTAGGDGTGGPDSAPDNTQGHVTDGSQVVIVDNYINLDLDQIDDSGLGEGEPDGVADWGILPKDRVRFKFQPPLEEVRLELGDVKIDRPGIAPDRNEKVRFHVEILPPLDPNDLVNQGRTASLTANVYSVTGIKVRDLFINETRPATAPTDPAKDFWDGRDNDGVIVPAGVYILRVVLEPDISRSKKPIVVVR
jgi:hypothetical protein